MPKTTTTKLIQCGNGKLKKLVPWFYGKGADIGCGARSINKDIVRVDIDVKVKPDILPPGINYHLRITNWIIFARYTLSNILPINIKH